MIMRNDNKHGHNERTYATGAQRGRGGDELKRPIKRVRGCRKNGENDDCDDDDDDWGAKGEENTVEKITVFAGKKKTSPNSLARLFHGCVRLSL